MSSSQNSSSNSNLAIVDGPGPMSATLDLYRDVRCPVNVELGTGSITVRQCLALERSSVIRLQQSAGEDLTVSVRGIRLAKGEVVVVEDSTSIRLTEICRSGINSLAQETHA